MTGVQIKMWGRWIKEIIAIALGGALGSVLRFILSSWIQGRTKAVFFPWGIFIVNMIGCGLIGILFGVWSGRMYSGYILRSALFIGLLGGFTTFSSFTLDSMKIFQTGANGTALLYILSSVIIGILATVLGYHLVKILNT